MKSFEVKAKLSPQTLSKLYSQDKLSSLQIAQKFDACVSSICYWLRKWNIPTRPPRERLTVKGSEEFGLKRARKINTETNTELAELLGIFWGDGCTNSSGKRKKYNYLFYCGPNRPLAERVSRLLNNIGLNPKQKLVHDHNKSWLWIVFGASKNFCSLVQNTTVRSLQTTFDSTELKRAFWQGFTEAEGSLYKCKDRRDSWHLRIVNTNRDLMEWGLEVFKELGYHPRFRVRKYRDKPHWKPLYQIELGRKGEIFDFLSPISSSLDKHGFLEERQRSSSTLTLEEGTVVNQG